MSDGIPFSAPAKGKETPVTEIKHEDSPKVEGPKPAL